MLHQNVSHSSDPTLQTERNVFWKTLPLHTLSPLTQPASDFLWRRSAMAWDDFLSPNKAASFALWFHYHEHSLSVSIFRLACLSSKNVVAILLSLHSLYLLIQWSVLLIKGASGDNLMDSMLPTCSVKGRIYGTTLLSKALGTEIVFLLDLTGTEVQDNSANLTWFHCW